MASFNCPFRLRASRYTVVPLMLLAFGCSGSEPATAGTAGSVATSAASTSSGATADGSTGLGPGSVGSTDGAAMGTAVAGGTLTGGTLTGGTVTGGTLTGGTVTGGTVTGGTVTGGTVTGGTLTGGTVTGGTVTGGTVTGGTATGSTLSTSTDGTGGSTATADTSGVGGSTSAGGTATTATDTSTVSTTGTQVDCSSTVAGTATRPQLTANEALEYSVLNYLAGAGAIGGLSVDNWNPTAGVGSAASFTPNFTVAQDGSGTHSTVQAALNAVSGSARQYILVKPGTYRETISIPSSAPPITLYGAGTDASQVLIVDGKSADSAGGTSASSTFTVKSAGFQALNLTISNDFATPASGSGLQAVALHTQGDQTILENVTLHGFQDTLYADTLSDATVARLYIKNSFIEGDTDFIFGRATVVIQASTIQYLSSRKGTSSGIHLAPSTHVNQPYGFLVIGSQFTSDATAPADRAYLGRSWDTSSTTPTPNGQVVIRESVLGAHIRLVDPWAAAATSSRPFSATGNRLQEYCNSGPGAG